MGLQRSSLGPRLSWTHPIVGQEADSLKGLETLLLREASRIYVQRHMYLTHRFESPINLDQTQMIVQLMQKRHFFNRTGSRQGEGCEAGAASLSSPFSLPLTLSENGHRK